MHIYEALAVKLCLKEEPKTLGENLNALQRFLPESVIESVKQSFQEGDGKDYFLTPEERKEVNAKYHDWWYNLPKPEYNTFRDELRHWMNALGIWGW